MTSLEQRPIALPPQLAGQIKKVLGRAGRGIDEAAFLQQLHFWTSNPKSAGWLVDGVKWVYNSLKAWLEQLPWLSQYGLRKAIANLKSLRLIEAVQQRINEFKRVMFYRINYEVLAESFGCDLARRCVESDRVDVAADRTSSTETSSETTSLNLEGCNFQEESEPISREEPIAPAPMPQPILPDSKAKTATLVKKRGFGGGKSSAPAVVNVENYGNPDVLKPFDVGAYFSEVQRRQTVH